MAYRAHVVTNKEQADPYSGSSLVPMLVIGLLLTFAGMIAAVGFELAVFSVIASEAKQSTFPHGDRWIASSLCSSQ